MRAAVLMKRVAVGVLVLFPSRGLAETPLARLGHPRRFSVVVEQFPMGLETEDFPVVTLAWETESALRRAGLPVGPRTEKPTPPFLHLSIVLIRQPYGYVLLTQGDLRERVSQDCTAGRTMEVSTWQERQWQVIKEPADLASVVRRAADDAVRKFINAYRAST